MLAFFLHPHSSSFQKNNEPMASPLLSARRLPRSCQEAVVYLYVWRNPPVAKRRELAVYSSAFFLSWPSGVGHRAYMSSVFSMFELRKTFFVSYGPTECAERLNKSFRRISTREDFWMQHSVGTALMRVKVVAGQENCHEADTPDLAAAR